MKKIIVILVITFAVNFVFAKPKSMAVATFDITGNAVSSDEAESITELYIAELVSTGKVSVVDRTNFNKLLKEMQFQTGDWTNSEKTVKLGTAAGAEIISRGQIIKLGSKMYLSATLIDVKTAKVLSSEKVQLGSIDDVFGIMAQFAKNAVENLAFKIGDIGPGGEDLYFILKATTFMSAVKFWAKLIGTWQKLCVTNTVEAVTTTGIYLMKMN